MSIDDATPEEWERAIKNTYDRGYTNGTPKEWDEVNKPLHYNTGSIAVSYTHLRAHET